MRKGPYIATNLAVWSVLLAAPLILDTWFLTQFAQYLTYGIFAMSLALIWGQCGLLCFGQAVFFGIGAYAMSLVTLEMIPGLEPLAYSWTGFLAAMLMPAAFAALLGLFLFYGKALHGAYLGIVTLAIAVIVERLAVNWNYIGGLNGLLNVPPVTLGRIGEGTEIWDDLPVYYIALGTALCVYLLLEAIVRSPYGTVLRAIRDGEERTGFFGYNTAAYKLSVFTLGAAVAGLAGALFVTQFSFASPAPHRLYALHRGPDLGRPRRPWLAARRLPGRPPGQAGGELALGIARPALAIGPRRSLCGLRGAVCPRAGGIAVGTGNREALTHGRYLSCMT